MCVWTAVSAVTYTQPCCSSSFTTYVYYCKMYLMSKQRNKQTNMESNGSCDALISLLCMLQVINMICNIRDESPNNVASALDNVLEALRSSELYAPLLLQHVRDDKVVNDLVEGLMTVSRLAHCHIA